LLRIHLCCSVHCIYSLLHSFLKGTTHLPLLIVSLCKLLPVPQISKDTVLLFLRYQFQTFGIIYKGIQCLTFWNRWGIWTLIPRQPRCYPLSVFIPDYTNRFFFTNLCLSGLLVCTFTTNPFFDLLKDPILAYLTASIGKLFLLERYCIDFSNYCIFWIKICI
jgi:hypothetical protein